MVVDRWMGGGCQQAVMVGDTGQWWWLEREQ